MRQSFEVPKTEAEQWQEKTAGIENFQLTGDTRGDFTRLIAVLDFSYHFSHSIGDGDPLQEIVDLIRDKIKEERPLEELRAVTMEEARKKESGVDLATESRSIFYTKRLGLLEEFIAKHGGDAERAELGIEKEE